MNIPVNYQISMPHNNSLNFRGKENIPQNIVAKSTKIVRNKRTYYPKGQQPLWQDLLEQYTKGYTRKEVTHYPSPEELTQVPIKSMSRMINSGKVGSNTKTVYYDAHNNVMATVYDIPKGDCPHMTLSTPYKDFRDWGRTGHVDSYDVDQSIEIDNARFKNYLNRLDLRGSFSRVVNAK